MQLSAPRRLSLALALLGTAGSSQAATYAIPAALTQPPFNCTQSAGTYTCPAMTLADSTVLDIKAPTKIVVNGGFNSGNSLNTNTNNNSLQLTVNGPATFEQGATVRMDLAVTGSLQVRQGSQFTGSINVTGAVAIAQNANFSGDISVTGTMSTGQNSVFMGDIGVSGDLSIGGNTNFNGTSNISAGGNLSVDHDVNLNGTIYAGANIDFAQHVTLNGNNSITAGGDIKIAQQGMINGSITAGGALEVEQQFTLNNGPMTSGGNMTIAQQASINGSLISHGGMEIKQGSNINGNVTVDEDLYVRQNSNINGTCKVGGTSNYPKCSALAATVHHFRVQHPGTGLTCTPATLRVYACSGADSAGTCAPYNGSTSGNVTAISGGVTQTLPFSIPANGGSTTVALSSSSAVTWTLAVSAQASSGSTCWNSTASTSSCNIAFADAGFLLNVPTLTSGTAGSGTVTAVRKSDNSAVCVPGFVGDKAIDFSCSYSNPTSNNNAATRNLTVSGKTAATFACTGSTSSATLTFSASGEAPINVTYPDAGQLSLTASATGMTGSASFIAVPQRFIVTTTPIAPPAAYVAGKAFTTTVRAVNSSNVTTTNYGLETSSTKKGASLSHQKCTPVAAAASAGTFTATVGNFSAGQGVANDANWSEVGHIDLIALNDNYLGLGASHSIVGRSSGASSNCGSVATGPFRPDHFDTSITRHPLYSYSGQPINVTVTARNAAGAPTVNYYYLNNGTDLYSREINLTALASNGSALAPGAGTFADTKIDAAAVTGTLSTPSIPGAALSTPKFTLPDTTPRAAPLAIRIRATDADGVSSATGTEASTEIRIGRLRMGNAYGSASLPLTVPVRAEYWSGRTWIKNVQDTVDGTLLPTSAIAYTRGGGLTGSTVNASNTYLVNGEGSIVLAKPTTPGHIDLAINLGGTAADDSCLANHPATTGAQQSWLRSQYGACGNVKDPSARATFGIFSPQSRRVIHVREATD
ncbi:DUF6701 domain-containing protein [Massilia sp. SR12]